MADGAVAAEDVIEVGGCDGEGERFDEEDASDVGWEAAELLEVVGESGGGGGGCGGCHRGVMMLRRWGRCGVMRRMCRATILWIVLNLGG